MAFDYSVFTDFMKTDAFKALLIVTIVSYGSLKVYVQIRKNMKRQKKKMSSVGKDNKGKGKPAS